MRSIVQRLSLLPLLIVGCQAAPRSEGLTRADLRAMLALPDSLPPQKRAAPLTQSQIDDLVRTATSSPDADARTAAALAAADERVRPLAQTLESIDAAIKICAENLSNAQTIAYKRQAIVYESAGHAQIRLDAEQGSMESTNRPLDISISGNGLFKVRGSDPNGSALYTRNGNFFVNKDRQLVLGMGQGYLLDPPITLPPHVTDISISETGEVDITAPGTSNRTAVGQIEIVQFTNIEGLALVHGSFYKATESSGDPVLSKPGDDGSGKTLQGFLEASNVDAIKESLRIKVLQDWRESIIRAVDAMATKTNN